MTRRAGHTLIELTATMAGLSVLVGGATAIGLQAVRDRRCAAELGDDTLSLRRAADAIERDLRAAAPVTEGTLWTLDHGTLRRDDVIFARRVAAFETTRNPDGSIRVRIELAPRTEGATRRASITTTVKPRIDGAKR